MLTKPTRSDELALPFRQVGDQEWASLLRGILEEYGVPLPEPATSAELRDLEKRLEQKMPLDWRLLLSELGPVDFDSIHFLSPERVAFATDLWFRGFLDEGEQLAVDRMLYVATTGSDNYYLFDVDSNAVRLASHDPAGIYDWIPSVGDLLSLAHAQLPVGKYGWPDDRLHAMVEEYVAELLDHWWRMRQDLTTPANEPDGSGQERNTDGEKS